MASSEDDKVPATPSTLEAVTEKTEADPAEDRTSDKLSDEGLGTSEVDKTEEEKLNEVSDASNEDLGSGLIESTKDFISKDPEESNTDESRAEAIPSAPVLSQSEEPVDTVDAREIETDGRETEEEQKETQEEKIEDKPTQVTNDDREPMGVKVEKEKEDGTEESRESQPEDKQEKVVILEEVIQTGEEKEPEQEEIADRIADAADGTDISKDIENMESDVIDTNINDDKYAELSVDEASAEVLLEKETTDSKPEEKPQDVGHEEAAQPEQEIQMTEEDVLEKQAPTNSANGVGDEVKETSEDSKQVVPSEDFPEKEDVEKAARADESISQDAFSVPESETDSETKMEQGSPAVMKPDVESDSGSSSAADSNSLDLNLSISSFLSKSKEGGSVSMQVL